MIGDNLLIEVNYIQFPDGDWETTVTGFSGRFDLTMLQQLISNLRRFVPIEVKESLEKDYEKEEFVTYILEVIYVPEDVEYGDGFGVFFSTPAYYRTGKIVGRSSYNPYETKSEEMELEACES